MPNEIAGPDNLSLIDSFKSPVNECNYLNNMSSIPDSPLTGRNPMGNMWGYDNRSVNNGKPPGDMFTLIYDDKTINRHRLTDMFGKQKSNDPLFWELNDNMSNNSGNIYIREADFRPENTSTEAYKKTASINVDESCDKHEEDAEDNEDMDDEGEGADRGSKKKFNKGLKLLSVIVRDIVVEKQSTTYKEVADIILRDTIKFENLNMYSQGVIAKEEQNIKRRVYDALNVLISAGILIKEGKKVRKNEVNKKIKINMKRMEINTLKSKIVPLLEKQKIRGRGEATDGREHVQEAKQHPAADRPEQGQRHREIHELPVPHRRAVVAAADQLGHQDAVRPAQAFHYFKPRNPYLWRFGDHIDDRRVAEAGPRACQTQFHSPSPSLIFSLC
jgi:hypothetical protein